MLLLPAFLRVAWMYLHDRRIILNTRYGVNPRNLVDIYLPLRPRTGLDAGAGCPVVVFVCGGAWVIGYKAWGCLLALALRDLGVLVIVPDYRNYPQGRVCDEIEDVHTALGWAVAHARDYGGDATRLLAVGQSVGAHLLAMAVLRQAWRETRPDGSARCGSDDPLWVIDGADIPAEVLRAAAGTDTLMARTRRRAEAAARAAAREEGVGAAPAGWRCADLAGFVGVSGPYDLAGLAPHLSARGLKENVLARMMEGFHRASPLRLRQYSPTWIAGDDRLLQHQRKTKMACILPPIHLLHGTSDATVPWRSSHDFYAALTNLGAKCTLRLYEGKTHTDPIIEDPMWADQRNQLLHDLMAVLPSDGACMPSTGLDSSPTASQIAHILPGCCVRWARMVNPF